MRKIVTAVSAAALSLSMLASAVPALAVTGYDSAYAGESAFVNISPGQTQNFQVFFANTGTTTWSRGTGTQVDLAACLADKVTCNAVDPSNAAWNSGWLSTTRYATTTQTTTAPGSLGTFSYNVAAPAGATGNHRFNGDLVLSTTGEKIHPEGYYQDATVGGGGGAATLTSMSPFTGTSNGGTSVTITGTGFTCTPAFPAVAFGATNAVVSSCGGTSIVATSPAHTPGAVTVTVTNSGAAASNGLTYTFVDTTPPQFTAMAIASNVVTVTYSKPVCTIGEVLGGATPDWTVKNVSNPATTPVLSDNTPVCTAAKDNGVTQANLVLATSPVIPPGAFVEVDLNATNPPGATSACVNDSPASCNIHFFDAAGNTIMAPQAQTATATNPSSNPPSMTTASGAVNATTVTINFSQPVWCNAATGGFAPGNFKLNSFQTGVTDPTFTAVDATNKCGAAQTATGTPLVLDTSSALPSNTTYTLTFTQPSGAGITAGAVQNVYNVALASGSAVSFTTGAADITPPVITDADLTGKSGVSTNFENSGDAFTLTFNKKMNSVTGLAKISLQDQDGTTATINCGTVGANGATCTFDTTTVTILTVTLNGMLTATAGTTPGMAIPFNITAITVITDATTPGNPPNILGSPDRLVEYASEAGG